MTQRLTGVEIGFDFTDLTAKEDAEYTLSEKQSWNTEAETELKTGGRITEYTTLETNSFLLDGSAQIFPDAAPDVYMGWWSQHMSDSSGAFGVNVPVVTIAFSEAHSSIGLTLHFSDDPDLVPKYLLINWLDENDTSISSKYIQPDASTFFCKQVVHNYKKITITFLTMRLPDRYLRLASVTYGLYKLFTDADLISASLLEAVDPIADSLPVGTLNYAFLSGDENFSLMDPNSAFSVLQQRQKMTPSVRINDDVFPMGVYYLDYPETDDDVVVRLSCVDLLGVIDQTDFRGGMYSNKLVSALLEDIRVSANLSAAELLLDPVYAETTVSGWLPIGTHRETLQQIAVAIGATVSCDRSGKIRIRPLASTISGSIGEDRKILSHDIRQESLVTGVEVTAHAYWATFDTATLVDDYFSVGTYEIRFTSPQSDVSKSNSSTATFSIVEEGANYAVINVTAAGTVILTGEAYAEQTRLVGYYSPQLQPAQKPNVIKLDESMTLISKSNAAAVAQRIYEYYQLRYFDSGELLADLATDAPGAKVQITGERGNLTGYITEMDTDLTGGVISAIKAIGGLS